MMRMQYLICLQQGAADGKEERDGTRFQGAASLGARGSGCTDEKHCQVELCRLKVQPETDRLKEQSLLVGVTRQ